MKRPAFQFYPADWLNDLSLRQCSPMARCLWIDMLCLMHDGDPYGHLRTIGGDITVAFLARTSGLSTTQVGNSLAELERFQVYSRSETGTIYSRRMVRDERTREARAKGGCASLENPNVPRPKSDASRNGVRTNGRISLPGSFGGSPSASSAASSSASAVTAAGASQPPPQESWPQTAATVGRLFPLSDADIVQKITAAALEVEPAVTDSDLSQVIDSALKRNQKSAGLFVKTVPAILRNRRSTGRDSPEETEQDALERARETWERLAPEERSELEKIWPQLRSGGVSNAEHRA